MRCAEKIAVEIFCALSRKFSLEITLGVTNDFNSSHDNIFITSFLLKFRSFINKSLYLAALIPLILSVFANLNLFSGWTYLNKT